VPAVDNRLSSFSGTIRLQPKLRRGSCFRVIMSGLYWNTTTLASGFNGSTPINAPLSDRSEPGSVLIFILDESLSAAFVGTGFS